MLGSDVCEIYVTVYIYRIEISPPPRKFRFNPSLKASFVPVEGAPTKTFLDPIPL
jgi:hypothetical protein